MNKSETASQADQNTSKSPLNKVMVKGQKLGAGISMAAAFAGGTAEQVSAAPYTGDRVVIEEVANGLSLKGGPSATEGEFQKKGGVLPEDLYPYKHTGLPPEDVEYPAKGGPLPGYKDDNSPRKGGPDNGPFPQKGGILPEQLGDLPIPGGEVPKE